MQIIENNVNSHLWFLSFLGLDIKNSILIMIVLFSILQATCFTYNNK